MPRLRLRPESGADAAELSGNGRLYGRAPRGASGPRSSAARRHFQEIRHAFSLQIGKLMMPAERKAVGTRVARFRPTALRISGSRVGMRFSSGQGITPGDSSPDHPDVPSASPLGVRVDTRRTSCTMSESPVFTGDSGSARACVLRNSGLKAAAPRSADVDATPFPCAAVLDRSPSGCALCAVIGALAARQPAATPEPAAQTPNPRIPRLGAGAIGMLVASTKQDRMVSGGRSPTGRIRLTLTLRSAGGETGFPPSAGEYRSCQGAD